MGLAKVVEFWWRMGWSRREGSAGAAGRLGATQAAGKADLGSAGFGGGRLGGRGTCRTGDRGCVLVEPGCEGAGGGVCSPFSFGNGDRGKLSRPQQRRTLTLMGERVREREAKD